MDTSEIQQPTAKFGTMTGVFLPTLLTILGVIMYIRLPWMVGNAGLIGALGIMALAMGITTCTGLSLSSIATNTRIGHGGPYAIITRSLGLEVGGSVGIPLYLTRPLGVAMYIFGFREGVVWMGSELGLELDNFWFALLIDLIVFGVVFGISYASADLAFRVQYVILAIIGISLVAVFAAPITFEAHDTVWWGSYDGFPEDDFATGVTFWGVFAVFFPATTGILAGANMSGDLEDPRRAIPRGALWAIGISTVVYVALAVWCARAAPAEELVSNYNIMMELSLWGPLVLAGLLGATFSSALSGMVGGPRILMAMGRKRIIPMSKWLGEIRTGEPRNALLVTGVLTLVSLMMRDLNTIAPLLTMFFLITYCVINLVVLIEESLRLVSFRPTLRVPLWVPITGATGCVFSMFIVSPTFGVIAVVVVLLIYMSIARLGKLDRADSEDVRSSVFAAFAEWAAAKVTELGQEASPRAWKPNLLIPVEDPAEIRGEYHFLLDVCRPEGSVKLLGLATKKDVEELQPHIERVGKSFMENDVFCTWSIVDSAAFTTGVLSGLQALQSAFFRPNILFLTVPRLGERRGEFADIIANARRTNVGILLMSPHPKAGMGQRRVINLWMRPPDANLSFKDNFSVANLNLTLLMGYRLARTWKAQINLMTIVPDADDVADADAFLSEVSDLARLPGGTRRKVMVGSFAESLSSAPAADLQILGLRPETDFDFIENVVEYTGSSCLFVADSGRESALA